MMRPSTPMNTGPNEGLPHNHHAVKHRVFHYVDGMAHTNGMESFWATMKRGYHGVYHNMSPQHLGRYAAEYEVGHNQRPMDTLDQIKAVIAGMDGKRLTYKALTT